MTNAVKVNGAVSIVMIIACQVSSTAFGQDDADKLHVLVATDTHKSFVEDGWADIARITGNAVTNLFIQEIPASRLDLQNLGGLDVTAENIVSHIQQLSVQPNDALLVYVACHGMTERTTHDHYLNMADDRQLRRQSLLSVMQQKNARLTVLITEACANFASPQKVVAMEPAQLPGYVESCRYLFFRHHGLVDINAAREGIRAWGDREIGGVFGATFTELLTTETHVADANQDGVLTWHEFSNRLDRATDERFKMRRNIWLSLPVNDDDRKVLQDQDNQRIYSALAITGTPNRIQHDDRFRFGINMYKTGAQGVRAGQVFPHTPAEWHGIHPGEILLEVARMSGTDVTDTVQVFSDQDVTRFLAQRPQSICMRCILASPETNARRTLYLRSFPRIGNQQVPDAQSTQNNQTNIVPSQTGWTLVSQVNGVAIYRDNWTGLEWTQTLGQVRSGDMGQSARARLAGIGFRLPTFAEFQTAINNHGAASYLNIHAGLLDYYETADPNFLINAWGGIRTPQNRQGVGFNWYLGVR